MAYKSEKVNPYRPEGSKKEQVIQMFDGIADNYDRLNGLFSLSVDNYWRKDSIKTLKPYQPKTILDIATGTGDYAILAQKILQPEKIVGIDISDGMMEVGKKKVEERGMDNSIYFQNQDCAALTFSDNEFDAAICAFGVRNFEDIDRSFQEILRVLKPGGVFIFLELSSATLFPFKQLFPIYSKYIIPPMAKVMSSEKEAYMYLNESIEAFPQGREMMLILQKNGFTRIRLRRYTGGICTLYIAEAPTALAGER